MHVYLTGFMGSGKTTVGRELAERLGRSFVDLDGVIEAREGVTIAEIFETRGEAEFRRLESAALCDLDDSSPKVVATGGGIVGIEENRRWMSRHGIVVWLDIDFEAIVERLGPAEAAKRPLFEDLHQARALFERRQREYGDSDLQIEVLSADSAAAVAAKIAKSLTDRECGI